MPPRVYLVAPILRTTALNDIGEDHALSFTFALYEKFLQNGVWCVCLRDELYPLLLTVREEPWKHKLENAQGKQT